MSLDNANDTPGDQPHTDAPDSDRAGRDLGWLDDAGAADGDAVFYEDQVQPETGILGFTLRELVIVGAWLVAFVVSFFPVNVVGGSIWTNGIGWILPIGVPTAAVFLVVLRRFSPDGIRRVGSLGIDQFASVAAAVAAVSWAQVLWSQIAATIETGMLLITWVTIVSLLAALVLVAATVAAPLVPRLREDFEGRMETLAHRNANPVRPVIARRRPARPARTRGADVEPAAAADPDAETPTSAASTQPEGASMPPIDSALPPLTDDTAVRDDSPAADSSAADSRVGDVEPEKDHYTDPVGVLEGIFADGDATTQLPVVGDSYAADDDPDRTRPNRDSAGGSSVPPRGHPEPSQPSEPDRTQSETGVAQPFWVLAMTERDVFDEHGQPLFRIGPHAWTLVIEDRGGAYVVRHEDGRIGYLHDITDITKG